MKYSLRSLMIVLLVLPPLLAGAYFVLNDIRLLVIAFGLIVGGGCVVAAFACLVAIENKLNELKRNWEATEVQKLSLKQGLPVRLSSRLPISSAPAPNPPKP